MSTFMDRLGGRIELELTNSFTALMQAIYVDKVRSFINMTSRLQLPYPRVNVLILSCIQICNKDSQGFHAFLE